jgi:hypothetical protein
MECCAKCAEKSSTTLQYSRKFNHGNVNESIPDASHIFGGKWYHDGVKKWGEPPSEIIEFAMQYQKEARGDYVVAPYKDEEQSSIQDMPATGVGDTKVKRTRKPKVAVDDATNAATNNIVSAPVKRVRKPKVAPEAVQESAIETAAPQTVATKKTRTKKEQETPYSSIVNIPVPLVHKEVSLPTHIETKLEEIDTDGLTIEYIKLTPFEVGGTTYFRDSSKNKLYKKIKEKGIGDYVGRWNPDTGMIALDIPDSDDEE